MIISATSIVFAVVVIFILGFLAFIVDSAPMIDASFKAFIKWALLVIAAIVLVVFVLSIFGLSSGIVIK